VTTAAIPTGSPAPDLAAIKTRQQATWASGDYAVIGTTLTIVPETLCESMDLRAGPGPPPSPLPGGSAR